MHELTAWVVSAMVTWVPPRTADEARYASIAEDIAAVAWEAPLFPSEEGVPKTALLMAAVASFESFYRADVDEFRVKGDHGRSLGLMQVQLRDGESCPDRLACLRLGRERLRESLEACRSLGFTDRLSVYTTGRCITNSSSRWRVLRALNFWKKAPYHEPQEVAAVDREVQYSPQ